MESLVKDLLENVVGRLTKIETQQEAQLMRESQIDQVIERLDTIHNRQTQLEHKLSDVSTQLDKEKNSIRDQLSTISTQLKEEKVFMRDQLKEAQDEILRRLTELQQQNVSTRSQAVSVGEEMKQFQATAGPNPVKETAEFCSQADGDVMDARLAKMSETLEQSVKAVTRAELVWLGNQTDQRISELSDKVDGLAEETLKSAESIKQENKDMATDFKIDVSEEIRAQNEPMMKEIQMYLTETADKNRESICQQREDMKSFYTEIVTQVKKTSGELPGTLEEIDKGIKDHMETVKDEIIADNNTAIVKMKDEFIETYNHDLKKTETHIETTVKESLDKVYTNLHKTKRDLVALVEGQSQIVRDRIAGPLPQHKNYVCDFYIENFRQLVGSDKAVTSLPWHINQFDSSVRSYANFLTSGKMRVRLVHGRHPRQLGLQTRSGVTLKVKATITDTSGQLRDLVVGEETFSCKEEDVKNNRYWGVTLGEMSCDELIQKGYGDKESYMNGALLVRYEIKFG